MRALFLISVIGLFAVSQNWMSAQSVYSPYPIIYIHGLDSEDSTWHETIAALRELHGDFTGYNSQNPGNVFNAMLNRYQDMTAMFGPDGLVGNVDDDVYTQRAALQPGAVFAVNFNCSWNQLPQTPYMFLYVDQWALGSLESQSNEASIVKQGYALKKCIEEVLRVTGTAKVILVGHSMGGLCAREYLQRRRNGVPRWWIEPSQADGHKVAKLVTIGTPHYGSDASIFVPVKSGGAGDGVQPKGVSLIPLVPNTSSEAVRDLRYSYALGSQLEGVFLFGGNEAGLNTSVLLSGWHNGDVDCNGYDDDVVLGINQELDASMPLPQNIRYTWITSDNGMSGGDLVVDLARQRLLSRDGRAYPVGISDTLLTNRVHWEEPGDVASIIRGLDEPGTLGLAYDISLDRNYRGAITYQSNMVQDDYDCYRLKLPPALVSNGSLKVQIRDSRGNGRQLLLAVLNDTGGILVDTLRRHSTNTTLTVDSKQLRESKGSVYVLVAGIATAGSWTAPYEFTAWYESSQNAPPKVKGLRDTTVDASATADVLYDLEDEDPASVSVTVTSSNQTLLPNANVVLIGNGSKRSIRLQPVPLQTGRSIVTIRATDGQFTTADSFQLTVRNTTGVIEGQSLSAAGIHIDMYPNPADAVSYLTIESSSESYVSLHIADLTGSVASVLYEGQLPAGLRRYILPVEKMTSGLYVVRLQSGKTVITKPLVVLH